MNELYSSVLVGSAPLTEAIPLDAGWGSWVDPRSAYNDVDGTTWLPIGIAGDEGGTNCFLNENELREARRVCRFLARKSPYVINAHANRINYIVGCGHTYKVVAKAGEEAADAKIEKVQAEIDQFCKLNKWGNRQREIVRRTDRDGECFLRFFETEDGLLVRFVEPGQVYQPQKEATNPAASWGVLSNPIDAESPVGYFVDDNLVDASEIQHRKLNTDSNVKRGEPLCWAALETLTGIRKVRRNLVVASGIQTSLAYVKEVDGGGTAAGSVRGNAADYYATNPQTQKTEFYEQQRAGKIITTAKGIKYTAPFAGVNFSTYVDVVADSCREFAAMLVMPEFMLTSDASNGNYASTMVAEGPAVRQFEAMQYFHREHDLEILERVLSMAVEAGRLSQSDIDTTMIQCECPPLGVRDKLQDAQTFQIYVNMGAVSIQTVTATLGYDYDQEQKNIEEHRDAQPDAGLDPLAQARDPNADPEEDPAEYQAT